MDGVDDDWRRCHQEREEKGDESCLHDDNLTFGWQSPNKIDGTGGQERGEQDDGKMKVEEVGEDKRAPTRCACTR